MDIFLRADNGLFNGRSRSQTRPEVYVGRSSGAAGIEIYSLSTTYKLAGSEGFGGGKKTKKKNILNDGNERGARI